MTAGKEQSDNFSATSRRNSDCLTALFLFLINFLELQDLRFFRELSSKTMTSDRYMSKWQLSTQEYSLQRPITWNYGEQMLGMHTTLNIGIIHSMRYYIKWVANLHQQAQTHGRNTPRMAAIMNTLLYMLLT